VKRLAIAAVAVLALAAAGCGGGGGEPLSKADYEQQLTEIGTSLDQSSQALGDAFQAQDISKAGDQIAAMQTDIRKLADQLDDITPPEDVADPHQDLIDGLRGMADDFDEFRDAVESKSVAKMTAFAQSFTSSESSQKINEAIAELKKKGYDLEQNSGG
jgi:hypothetical protein